MKTGYESKRGVKEILSLAVLGIFQDMKKQDKIIENSLYRDGF
jgi:hypothetical protein